ncbi:MAG: STAS domain-containing protein [Thermoanaerobaculia bacterium]
MVGVSRPVVALRVAADGEEAQLEILELSSSGSPSSKELVLSQIEQGRLRLILDLSIVDRLDSSGIAVIVGGLTQARKSGGELVMTGLDPEIRTSLRVTKIDSVVPIFDSVAGAVSH